MTFFTTKLFQCTLYGLLIITGVFATYNLLISFTNLLETTGNDLRTRTIGTSVFLNGSDPYTFYPTEETPDELKDPLVAPNAIVNRLTVTPPVLLLGIPFTFFPFEFQKVIWFFIEWSLLLGTLFLLLSEAKDTTKKALISITFFLFSITPIWKTHIEFGQVYILYAFLFALSYKLGVISKPRSKFLSGFIVGTLVSMRFTFFPLLVPLFLFRKGKFLKGGIYGAIVGVLVPILFQIDIWISYFKSMIPYGNWELFRYENLRNYVVENKIENNARIFTQVGDADSSIQGIAKFFFNIHLSATTCIILMVIVFGVLCFFALKKKKPSFSESFVYFGISVFLFEMLLPAPRYSYSDIVFLVPLALTFIHTDTSILMKRKSNVLLLFALWSFSEKYFFAPYFLILYLYLSLFSIRRTDSS